MAILKKLRAKIKQVAINKTVAKAPVQIQEAIQNEDLNKKQVTTAFDYSGGLGVVNDGTTLNNTEPKQQTKAGAFLSNLFGSNKSKIGGGLTDSINKFTSGIKLPTVNTNVGLDQQTITIVVVIGVILLMVFKKK
jgi:hypothetical protein